MALSCNVGTWPESFFKAELNQNDMRILGDGISEMEKENTNMESQFWD